MSLKTFKEICWVKIYNALIFILWKQAKKTVSERFMEKHWELKKLNCEGVKCLEHNVLFLRLKNLIALRLQWILYCVFCWDSTWALSDICWWACWSHQDSLSLTPDMNDKSPLTDRKNLLKPKPQAATRKKNSTENAPESKILQGKNFLCNIFLPTFIFRHLQIWKHYKI